VKMDEPKKILPSSGIWSVEDLARYLGQQSGHVMQKLSDNGIKTLSFGSRYRLKFFRLEDLRAKND